MALSGVFAVQVNNMKIPAYYVYLCILLIPSQGSSMLLANGVDNLII